jgi:hypothetical protein
MNHVDTLPGTRSDTSPPKTSPAPSRAARLAALGAVAGPILFTLAWLILGFLSPGYTIYGTRIAPYSPISDLAWFGMSATFRNWQGQSKVFTRSNCRIRPLALRSVWLPVLPRSMCR